MLCSFGDRQRVPIHHRAERAGHRQRKRVVQPDALVAKVGLECRNELDRVTVDVDDRVR